METKHIAPVSEESFSPQLRTLEWLVRNYLKGDIQLPDYQRKAVWLPKQRIAWAESVRRRVAVATFFVYKLPTSQVWWLADGSQRLHATLDILEHPTQYKTTRKEVEDNLDRCNISVAFLHCADHMEGYYHFVHLNRGYAPTPAEVYRGFLVQTTTGKYLYEEIEQRMKAVGVNIVRKPRGTTRATGSKESRDNLALFYQYVTRTDRRHFWDVASSNIGDTLIPLEQHISDWASAHSKTEIENSIREFAEYVNKSTELLTRVLLARKGEGTLISASLYRHLLHLCIYCRNTGYPVVHRDKIIDYIILCSDNGNARLNMVDEDGRFTRSENAHLDELSKIEPIVCELLKLPWEMRKTKAKETV